MGTSISSWENVGAYFTFADNPIALGLFTICAAAIVVALIASIAKHENDAFEKIEK
jgi:TctA family transporter